MLHREVLLRPTEPDVKEIFSAMKMGLMGETASHELKQMMERLLQASKRHLRYERPVSGQRQKKFGSGSNAEEMVRALFPPPPLSGLPLDPPGLLEPRTSPCTLGMFPGSDPTPATSRYPARQTTAAWIT